MTGALASIAMFLACTGLGISVLRFIVPKELINTAETTAVGAVVGYGVYGWLGFFLGVLGVLHSTTVWLIIGASLIALAFHLWRTICQKAKPTLRLKGLKFWPALMATLIALIALLDGLESLPPPTDADSLAYHFVIPKYFTELGYIVPVERAVDGIAPLINHMTYTFAYIIGGERALTTWTFITGWMAPVLLLAIARPLIPTGYALLLVLVFVTTPLVLYGAGTGQVEIPNAAFVLLTLFGLLKAREMSHHGLFVLIGLGVGFFMGGKYIGLLFAVATAFTILVVYRPNISNIFVLLLTTALAGGQWYVWNYIHTGDPVFPMLTNILTDTLPTFWDEEHYKFLHNEFASHDQVLPSNIIGLIGYFFYEALSDLPQFGSVRSGLRPLIVLVIPFLLIGIYQYRKSIIKSRVFTPALLCFAFLFIWIHLGVAQRARHIIPIYPVIALVMIVTSYRVAKKYNLLTPLHVTCAFTILFQITSSLFAARGSIEYSVQLKS